MSFITPDFAPASAEISLLVMVCIILMVDLFLTEKSRVVSYLLAQSALVIAFFLTLLQVGNGSQLTFNGSYISDPMGQVLKLAILASVFVVFLYSRGYLQARNLFKGEFYLLGLFGTLGMMVMVSAHTMLTLYLGLELLSLSMYALVAMQRDSLTASEAAMKYFVLGAMASAMLLYGMSIIYGLTGTIDLGEIANRVSTQEIDLPVLIFGMVFLIAGIAFKLGAVPFHMWVPDVYHGAPTAVTLYISTAPKLAAFAMLMRLLVDGLGELEGHWHDILLLLSVLSIVLGNVVAIAQTNLKRMFAYSGISHIGFMLLGVLAGTQEGYATAMFYAIVYVLMGLGGFGMIILMSRAGFESDQIDDFKGLNSRSPWFAAMMMIILFSMAGMPPFLGFWAKLAVIEAIVTQGHIWLAMVAVLFSVIGAFYYLRVIKVIYFDEPESSEGLVAERDLKVVLSANGLAILGLGIFPGALLALCIAAVAG